MKHNKGYSYDFQGDAQKHEAQNFMSQIRPTPRS